MKSIWFGPLNKNLMGHLPRGGTRWAWYCILGFALAGVPRYGRSSDRLLWYGLAFQDLY